MSSFALLLGFLALLTSSSFPTAAHAQHSFSGIFGNLSQADVIFSAIAGVPNDVPDVEIAKLGLPPQLPLVNEIPVNSTETESDPSAEKQKPSELSPFCNSDIPRGTGPYNSNNCASYAELEVDQILMLIELFAKDVPPDVATAFYKEIACLSRRNIVKDVKGLAMVCFREDYSKIVGELLAKYVEPVLSDLANGGVDVLPTSARLVKDGDLSDIIGSLNENSERANTVANSCCSECYNDRYFPYLTYSTCVKVPEGNNCCHKVCQALQRVKVGMDTSVRYCCPKLHPQPCWF